MEWFPGNRPTASEKEADKHMEQGKKALAKLNPDIFIGVEIRDWAAFHELCSAVPGLTVHVVSSFFDPETGEIRPQQIGIASKLKCRAALWEPWQANVPNLSRGFSFAALEHPSGALLMIYGNHFKSNRGSDTPEGAQSVADMRNESANQLVMHRDKMRVAFSNHEIMGWIVAGDFNTNHDGQFPLCRAIEILMSSGLYDTWTNTPPEKRHTWLPDKDTDFKPTTFDFILTDGIKRQDAILIDMEEGMSDHPPIGLLIEPE
ncbi:MAG: hypothetical protein EAZ42_08590 [Verrucomicrobia bacterium]|nr:MAG: hypothetical protein EAZ42_08590 [Verrucomicrobiota bacterium]